MATEVGAGIASRWTGRCGRRRVRLRERAAVAGLRRRPGFNDSISGHRVVRTDCRCSHEAGGGTQLDRRRRTGPHRDVGAADGPIFAEVRLAALDGSDDRAGVADPVRVAAGQAGVWCARGRALLVLGLSHSGRRGEQGQVCRRPVLPHDGNVGLGCGVDVDPGHSSRGVDAGRLERRAGNAGIADRNRAPVREARQRASARDGQQQHSQDSREQH